jgi:hypothetical protein
MKIQDFTKIQWVEEHKNPLIHPPFFSPILADPSFLFPEKTPDGIWRLYAHSIWGIHEFQSKDGVEWKKHKTIVSHGMRPYLFFHEGKYFLIFEKYKPFRLSLSFLPIRWYSEIQMLESDDLLSWKNLRTLVRPNFPFAKSSYGESVSNPCIIFYAGLFYLFFSSSLVRIKDCGFNEPLHICMAAAKNLEDEFEVYPSPLISPDPNSKNHNLSSGSIKLLSVEDGLLGMQNRIFIDLEGKSRSEIFAVHSQNIFQWNLLMDEPILKPEKGGWKNSHIYAFDFRFRNSDALWYLYFNARNDWHWTKGKEKIGLLYGKTPR